jgi:hypothetical protein
MHRFPVGEQYNAQKLAVHLRDRRPASNPPVLLNGFLNRLIDNALNPFLANDGAIWPLRVALKY